MIELVGGIFLFAVASAFIPVLNIEAALALAAQTDGASVLVLTTAATVGQMSGKVLWYYGGRESLRVPWMARKLEKPKWRANLDKWQERTERNPSFTAVLLFASAFVGVPPYAVMAVVAGVLRAHVVTFLVTGVVGRFLRFFLILEAAQWAWPLL